MHKYLIHTAYGWLALSGILHFAADVLFQYLRGQRKPGLETSLYYGLNSAFSLGQIVFGLLGLFLAWRGASLITATPVLILSMAAALGWLAIAFLFMDYWEPKLNVGIFCALIAAAFVIR